jgi:small-conductance mechanosensitive channel
VIHVIAETTAKGDRMNTSEQLLKVLASFREILIGHPNVETGKISVRFVGVGAYSLDVEVVAYVNTSDYDEFLEIQQELLLRMLRAVEQAEQLWLCRCRRALNRGGHHRLNEFCNTVIEH